jgi:hypothetical protein
MNTRRRLIIAHKPDPNRRTSSDSVWPLRGADGLTWAERKAKNAAKAADAGA